MEVLLYWAFAIIASVGVIMWGRDQINKGLPEHWDTLRKEGETLAEWRERVGVRVDGANQADVDAVMEKDIVRVEEEVEFDGEEPAHWLLDREKE